MSQDDQLFARLGGATAIANIVKDMYARVLADDELAHFFKDVDMDRLHRMQLEFITSALGGPVSYSGAELQQIHKGRGIQPHHFSKFVGHLADAMQDHSVSAADIDDMLGRMAMFRDKVVGGSNVDG